MSLASHPSPESHLTHTVMEVNCGACICTWQSEAEVVALSRCLNTASVDSVYTVCAVHVHGGLAELLATFKSAKGHCAATNKRHRNGDFRVQILLFRCCAICVSQAFLWIQHYL